MKNSKKRIPKRWIILVFAIVIGLVLSLLNFFVWNPAKEYASASLELLYDGATSGLAPNGEAFSIESIKNEALLAAAIEESGLTGSVTAEELSENLTVRGSFPANIINTIKSFDSLLDSDPTREIKADEYYPTSFGVSLYNGFSSKLSSAQLTKLVESVLSQFKKQYVESYSAGIDWSAIDGIWDSDKYDYSQAVTTMALRLDYIKKYAEELYNAKPTFTMADGSSFNSIVLRANTIENNDIQSLSANITINALSKDAARLRSQYQYEIEQLNYRLGALTANLSDINALIDSYETDSTIYIGGNGGSVVTVEGNSKETYEALNDEKQKISEEISSINVSIEDYQSKIDDLAASIETGASAAYAARIDETIKAAKSKIKELSDDFDAMTTAYNERYIKASDVRTSAVGYHGNKLVSGSFIKAVIKSEAPVCAVALVIILLIGIFAEKRKQKKAAKTA